MKIVKSFIMKSLFVFILMLFLSEMLYAQNATPLNLKKILIEQSGNVHLNNFIIACENPNAEIRMHRSRRLLNNELVEYIKGKYNLIFLNKEMDNDILSHFEISKYPAILIVDPEGKELVRTPASITKDIIKNIDFAFQRGLTFVDREKKLKDNPPYGAMYAYYLSIVCHMPQAAERVLLEMLNKPLTDRCFITKGKKAMSEVITCTDSPVISVLSSRSDEIRKILGKSEYNKFRTFITFELIRKVYRDARLHKQWDVFFKLLSDINANKFMACDFSRFLEANNDKFHSFDAEAVYDEYIHHLFKMDIESQLAALDMIDVFAPYKFQKELSGKYLDFYNLIIRKTQDKRLKELATQKIKFYNIVR